MNKSIFMLLISTTLITGFSGVASAQYYNYKSVQKDVVIDLSVLDDMDARQNLDTTTHTTVPAIPPVTQMPLSVESAPVMPAGMAENSNAFPPPIVEKPNAPRSVASSQPFIVRSPVMPSPAVQPPVVQPSAVNPPIAAQMPLSAAGMPSLAAMPYVPAPAAPTAMAGPQPAQRRILKPPPQTAMSQTNSDEDETQEMPPEDVTAQIRTTTTTTATTTTTQVTAPPVAPAVLKPPAPQPRLANAPVNRPVIKPVPAPVMPRAAMADMPSDMAIAAPRRTNQEPPRTVEVKKTAPSVHALTAPVNSLTSDEQISQPPVVATDMSEPDTLEMPVAPATPIQHAPADRIASALSDMPHTAALATADMVLSFSGNSSDLDEASKNDLSKVIDHLNTAPAQRLQVRAFATGEDGSLSSARRISLSRALSVRSYLMDKGIKPTQVDVRAMGTETDQAPVDRVDLQYEN